MIVMLGHVCVCVCVCVLCVCVCVYVCVFVCGMVHFIYYILLSYVRRGLCDPFFFSSACAVRLMHSTKSMHSARPTMLCIHLVFYLVINHSQ